MKKYTCPCCGYKSLQSKPSGTFAICRIYYWKDDNVQFDDPDYRDGANQASLREAQRNFAKFGVSDLNFKGKVRLPTTDDGRDPNWQAL